MSYSKYASGESAHVFSVNNRKDISDVETVGVIIVLCVRCIKPVSTRKQAATSPIHLMSCWRRRFSYSQANNCLKELQRLA